LLIDDVPKPPTAFRFAERDDLAEADEGSRGNAGRFEVPGD
jgi:hypothetical protein